MGYQRYCMEVAVSQERRMIIRNHFKNGLPAVSQQWTNTLDIKQQHNSSL